MTNPVGLIAGDVAVPDVAAVLAREMRFLHWPLAFPEVFAGDKPGFDVVVGNPPWEEVTVEELAFYARYSPRLRGLVAAEREAALSALKAARPELAAELRAEQVRIAALKKWLGPEGGSTKTLTSTSSSVSATGLCSLTAAASVSCCHAAHSSPLARAGSGSGCSG
jgi:hypothetical protein